MTTLDPKAWEAAREAYDAPLLPHMSVRERMLNTVSDEREVDLRLGFAITAYLDALSSLPAQAVGVRLVPVEKLTPEMRAAAETAARKINPGRSEDHIKSVAMDGLSIYRAIVAAAP